MGVISFFKNKIYDSRLKKAGKLLEEGKKEASLEIYRGLLGKHAEAAGILADIFFEDIKRCVPKEQSSLLKTIVELPGLNGTELIWDRSGYDNTLSKVVSYLYADARNHLNAERYKDAYIILNELRAQKLASSDQLKDYVDACLGCVKNHESIDLNSLKGIINNLGDEIIIFRTYDQFIPYAKEFSPEYIKSSKWFILHEKKDYAEAVKVFERCWTLTDADEKEKGLYIGSIFKEGDDNLLKELFKHVEAKPEMYLNSDIYSRAVVAWAYGLSSHEESIDHLVRLHSVGVKVQAFYETRVHSWLSELDLIQQRDLLNRSLTLYPSSEKLLEDKLNYAKTLAKEKHYPEALEICDELTGKHNLASLIKSKVYVCIALDETEPDKKMEALSHATELINTDGISKSEFDRVTSKINELSLDSAESFHKNGNKTRAYEIVRGIYTVRSAQILARFLAEDVTDVAEDNRILYFRDSIEELKARNVKEALESDEYVGIWTALTDVEIKSCKKADHNSTIEIMKGLVEDLEKEATLTSSPGRYTSAIEKVKKEQIKRMYLLARDQEKNGQIEQAAALYSETKKVEGKASPTLADFRYVICKLKAGDNNVSVQNSSKIESLLSKAPETFAEERNEVAYRYALQLLRAGKTDSSLNIVNQYLPQEQSLKQACEQQYIVQGLKRLDEFNSKLDLIRRRELSSDDAIHLVNHMLEFADDVKYVINISRPTLSKYRKSIKNYAILKLFDEGRFDVAFDKLKKEHSDFLEDLTSLRNIAIVCLNMAESGMIDEDNCGEVIAIWLTAIYQERLFVKSLDYTSWDDQFTFSLANAYGHFDEDTVGDLPDNVNFDEPDGSTTNVAIKDVQQALLNRFEAAINDNDWYLQLFNYQKEAMDHLVELNLDEKCRIVAPYIATESEEIFAELESAFETDRINHYDNYEDVLATGYQFGLRKDEYCKFYEASNYYDRCIRAINNLNYNDIIVAFTSTFINAIQQFPKKWESLIAFVKGKVGSLGTSDKSQFETNYNCFITVCQALNEGTISFPFATYVMQHIVAEVNGHRISKAKASDYILSLYLLDKTNPRVQDNLTTLFEMLSKEEDNNSKNAVKNILNKVQKVNASLYNQLNLEYELGDITSRLKNNTISDSTALNRLYDMYTNAPNNSSICDTIAQISSLCLVKIVFGNVSNSSTIIRIVNQLIANRSPELRMHRKVYQEAYDFIWNKLPADTQLLLEDSPVSALLGQSLSEKGLVLKQCLRLLKQLGR